MNFINEQFEIIKARLLKSWHEMTWVFVGQLMALLGGAITLKVLTHIMGPEDYGQLAIGLSISGLINLFVYGPIGQAVLRFFAPSKEKNELNSYFVVFKKIHWILALSIFFITALTAIFFYYFESPEWALIIAGSSLYSVVAGINLSYQSLQTAARQRKLVALHQGFDVWIRFILASALLHFFSTKGYFALVGFALGTLITTLSQNYFFSKSKEAAQLWSIYQERKKNEKDIFKQMLTYVLSFTTWAVFGAINNYGDRWILQGLFGSKEVGIYAGINQIANAPILFFVGMVSQFMTPIIFERAGTMTTPKQLKNSDRLLRQTVGISALILFVITSVAFLIGRTIVGLLTTPLFSQYSGILWVIILGLSFFNIGQLLTIKGFNSHRPQIYILPKAIQAISFLVSAYSLGKSIGLSGIAISSCGSSLIYLLLVIYANQTLNNSLKKDLSSVKEN